MRILAIDPATKCGWACSTGGSGTWDLSMKRDESGGMRLIRLQGKLNEVHTSTPIGLLVYEAARFAKGIGSLVVAGEIQGQLKVWATTNGVEFYGFSSSEIKTHATGKGNASKAQMMDAAKARFGPNEWDDNETDAVWLLDLALLKYLSRRLCPTCRGAMYRAGSVCLDCEGSGSVC